MNPKLRILHLEDSETDCELIRQLLLEEGIDCKVERHETCAEFTEKLQEKDFDIIFADSSLPEFSGLRALELSRRYAPEVPFIFVSGTMGEETAIESLRNGATDYVLKQRLSRLGPAVRRAMAEAATKRKNIEMEQRLQQSQRLEAVGTLAGGVAHDFNNILTIIQGYTSLLPVERHQPERVLEISATIDRAAQRGSELVHQLLAFARKSDGSFVSTDINQRIREIGAMLRETFPRNIEFEFQLDETLPKILADPGQVERVLVNLATNARDAMPNGGKITFATSKTQEGEFSLHSPAAASRDYLCLQVIDTGIGMDEATRRHIFEPFFTTKAKGKGTGLGMPVVYGLMQTHNGRVDVWSEPGKGTRISLFFPIPAGDMPQVQAQTLDSPKMVGGTETVLVVDDEPDVSSLLEVILQANGYHVLSAGSAEQALDIFQAHRDEIDLLFSDLGLPKLDGFELSERLRELKPGLKTIIASGYTDGSIKTRMAEREIDGFVQKPYNIGTLLQTIRSILDRHEAMN
jgi:two-component system cell cycle sensor histidine kinase/response regulator CckA